MNEWNFPEGEFLGQRITLLDQHGVLTAVSDAVSQRKPLYQASLNAAKVVSCRSDGLSKELLDSFDVICADGISVAWGSRLLGLFEVERIAGIDLMQALLQRAEAEGWRVYFLGATQEVLNEMQASLLRRHPQLCIAGLVHGYHPAEEDENVATAIADSGADLLFVGMPSPRKEIFLRQQRQRLHVSFAMGVGGTFDVLAGKVNRAPAWVQKAGMEWAFRLAQEPARLWKRYLVSNSRFIMLLMQALLSGRPTKKVSH